MTFASRLPIFRATEFRIFDGDGVTATMYDSSQVKQKLKESPPESDLEKGLELRKQLNGRRFGTTSQPLIDEAPELEHLVNEVLFGRIWSRGQLDLRERSIAVIAALATTGQRPQLKHYIANALNVGLTREDIVELLMQLVFYIGLPPVTNALEAAHEVFAEELDGAG